MAIYTFIRCFAGAFPKEHIDRHTIKFTKVVTLDLSMEESVQVFGLGIVGAAGLLFLGNYGVRGDFRNEKELMLFVSVMIVGAASLLITAIWKGLVILAEIKRDKEAAGVEVSKIPGVTVAAPSKRVDRPVTELSSFWVGTGVAATTFYVTALIAGSTTLAIFLLPLICIGYGVSFFGQVSGDKGEATSKERAFWVHRPVALTPPSAILTTNYDIVYNAMNTNSHATCFARCSLEKEIKERCALSDCTLPASLVSVMSLS